VLRLRTADSPTLGLAKLWSETTGDSRISIAILDAPVDRANSCLAAAKIDQAWLGEQAHCSSHGTEVASVIFGQHNSAVRGIAPRCRGISIPIYDCDPVRSPATDQAQLARAIHEALAAGAHVINVSAGQLVPSGIAEPELAAAVRACASAGVLIVAAVGNDGCDCLHVPAALPCVLAVGAMRWDGSPAPGSNWGSAYRTQGILAPGEDINVCGANGLPVSRTGSSYATAIVAGVAALLLSRELKLGRSPRPLLVRKALLKAADRSVRASADERHRFLAGRLDITATTIFLDTWSNTMTDSMNLDLPGEGISAGGASCDAVPVSIQPSAERSVDAPRVTQSGILPTQPERQERRTEAVEPSACSSCRGERQLVYALGQLSHDFSNEASYDSFRQRMKANPFDPEDMQTFLDATRKKEPWHASALLWTLEISGLPLYVIRPDGPYTELVYERLQEYFSEQLQRGKHGRPVSERVAVPGVITGQARLFSGQTVPVINPEPRGLCNWNREDLIDAAIEAIGGDEELSDKQKKKIAGLIDEFLDRIYFELRNNGRTSQERALNYAGTNLVEVGGIFIKEEKARRALDMIRVEPSSISRPGSDCWDITLAFFNTKRPLETVRTIHRYTVDVSDVIPVTVGHPRSWKER